MGRWPVVLAEGLAVVAEELVAVGAPAVAGEEPEVVGWSDSRSQRYPA